MLPLLECQVLSLALWAFSCESCNGDYPLSAAPTTPFHSPSMSKGGGARLPLTLRAQPILLYIVLFHLLLVLPAARPLKTSFTAHTDLLWIKCSRQGCLSHPGSARGFRCWEAWLQQTPRSSMNACVLKCNRAGWQALFSSLLSTISRCVVLVLSPNGISQENCTLSWNCPAQLVIASMMGLLGRISPYST